jgi:hypothetical protein
MFNPNQLQSPIVLWYRCNCSAIAGWYISSRAAIMGAVAVPDFYAQDPLPDRERFYRRHIVEPGRWLPEPVRARVGSPRANP